MEYKRFGNKIIVRIDKDEEILEQVKKLALKENIRLAAVQALGATNSFTGAVKVRRGCYAAVEAERCVGCGKCAKLCPVGCIEVKVRAGA